MNKIAVLIDFTEGCKVAIEQAKVLALAAHAEIHAIYFSGDPNTDASKTDELQKFVHEILGDSVPFFSIVSKNDLMHNAAFVIGHINPIFVVIGTHGIHGIKQHLFGAYILKLVQTIPYPCIVIQENTKVNPDGFKKILFPVGPHKHYQTKIEQTARIAKIWNSDVVQYEIDRSLLEPNHRVLDNAKKAKEYFASLNVKFSEVSEDTTVISVGYARQTIKYATENGVDLISVMADVPADEIYFGRADKENILTNPTGIPVLCCNQ